MKKVIYLLGMFLLFSAHTMFAQKTITGTVTDQNGGTLPGATVRAQGFSGVGTVTDMDGRYSLEVPNEATNLIFTFVGMQDEVVAIGAQTTINVSMKPADVGLDEVVVVAYGVQKKEAQTGSVGLVKKEAIESIPVTSAEKLLQGKVAGMQINSGSGMPGSNTQIRIRGTSSINAGNEPLWVIDGVPVISGDYNTATNTGNVLAGLNSNDIESITVLKDAAAASIYGSRAANGVILVTTKSGRAGKTTFNLRSQYGVSERPNTEYRFMNAEEIHTYMRDAVKNLGLDPDNPALETSGYYLPNSLLSGDLTNWWDEVFRVGITQNYELEVAGGNEKTKTFISGGYFDQEGIQIGSEMTRLSFRSNVDHKVNKKLAIGTRMSGAYIEMQDQASSLAYANPFWAASSLLPWENAYNEDGTFNWNLPSNNDSNPLGNVELNDQRDKQYKFNTQAYLTFDIIPGLQFKSINSMDWLTSEGRVFRNPETPDGEQSEGYLYNAINQNRTLTSSNTLNYMKTFDAVHNLRVMAGYEIQRNKYFFYTLEGAGIGSDITYMSNASKDKDVGYGLSEWAFLSSFGIVDYNFDERYFLTASFRRDGSSRFGENTKYANFWALGASWNLHNESFLSSVSAINVLKLRASYGLTGNASIGNYESYGLYGSRVYNGVSGLAPDQLANPDLTWENSTSYDIGLDFTMFGFLTGTADVYKRITSDMLLSVPLSRTTGFTSLRRNVGEMYNQGIEFSLGGNFALGDFNINLSGNIAYNESEITDLAGQEEVPDGFWRRYRLNGDGVREYYVFDWAGVNPVNGNGLWYDENGRITEDAAKANRIFQGKAEPDYVGGFSLGLSWKGIAIDSYFNYMMGNSVYVMERRYIDSDGYNWGSIQSYNLLDYWKEPGDVVANPKPIPGNLSDSNAWGTSRFLEDGSFLRFKNLSVSYSLPSDVVKKAKLEKVRFYMNAVNLYVWHDVSYWDPERDVTGGDYAIYPNPRTITFGIDIGF